MRLDCAASLTVSSRFVYSWTLPHMQRDFTGADLWRILSRNRYEGCIVSAITGQPGETEWLLEQAAAQPWIRGVIGGPVPGVCGLRCSLDELDSLPRLDLPIDLVITPASLLDAPARLQGRRAALVNNGGARYDDDEFPVWAEGMKALAAEPLVMVKVAGLINEASADGWDARVYRPYIRFLLDVFGPERLMYGSDWPNCMKVGTWKEAMAAFTQALGAQSQQTRDLILGGNAARFYGLGAAETP